MKYVMNVMNNLKKSFQKNKQLSLTIIYLLLLYLLLLYIYGLYIYSKLFESRIFLERYSQIFA